MIKLKFLKGLKPQEIIYNFNKMLRYLLHHKQLFPIGIISTNTIDSESSGRSNVAMIEEINNIALNDRKVKLKDIEDIKI